MIRIIWGAQAPLAPSWAHHCVRTLQIFMATYVMATFQKMCDVSTSLGLNYNILLVAMQLYSVSRLLCTQDHSTCLYVH